MANPVEEIKNVSKKKTDVIKEKVFMENWIKSSRSFYSK